MHHGSGCHAADHSFWLHAWSFLFVLGERSLSDQLNQPAHLRNHVKWFNIYIHIHIDIDVNQRVHGWDDDRHRHHRYWNRRHHDGHWDDDGWIDDDGNGNDHRYNDGHYRHLNLDLDKHFDRNWSNGMHVRRR